MPDHQRGRRDELFASLARRGRSLPRPAVVGMLAILVTMTVWGFIRSLT